MTLAGFINRNRLKELAGNAVFGRGLAYFQAQEYSLLAYDDTQVKAEVTGSEVYDVKLWLDADELNHDCTCPHHDDGYFCKHCVAVGLAWLEAHEQDQHEFTTAPSSPGKRSDWQQIEQYLQQQTTSALVQLLLSAARTDKGLKQKLLLASACLSGSTAQLTAYKKNIAAACTQIASGEYYRYDHGGEGLHLFDEALAAVQDLLPAQPTLVVELCEYAYEQFEPAIQYVDDSNGEYCARLSTIADLHCRACLLARPDPLVLAEKLFAYERNAEFDFEDCVIHYREALGEQGIAHFRALAEQAWQHYLNTRQALQPRKTSRWQSASASATVHEPPVEYETDYRLSQIMLTLADLSGDLAQWVTVKSANLTWPYHYLQIAERYQQAGQHDKALGWAEQGLTIRPEHPDNRLRDFLAERYLEARQHNQVLAMIWPQFFEQPSLANYQKLHAWSTRLHCWPEQRNEALQHLQQQSVQMAHKLKRNQPDHSLLIAIALWEQDPDQALAYSRSGSYSLQTGLQLADILHLHNPEVAVQLYKQGVREYVEQTNNQSYAHAEALVKKIRHIWQQQGHITAFSDYLAELGLAYKAKRNFMRLLNLLAQQPE